MTDRHRAKQGSRKKLMTQRVLMLTISCAVKILIYLATSSIYLMIFLQILFGANIQSRMLTL